MITLTPLNRREAVRYLGGAGVQMKKHSCAARHSQSSYGSGSIGPARS